jgi:hypothetical protein
MIAKLIRCTKCNQVAPHCGSLGHFGESSLLSGVEWSTEDLENQREFFRCHPEHPMEELHADPDSYISDKAGHGSMKAGYFEASNGQQRFLIKRTKEGLGRAAFRKDELKMIRQFIQENRQPEDVLSLLIKRKISILAPSREGAKHPL